MRPLLLTYTYAQICISVQLVIQTVLYTISIVELRTFIESAKKAVLLGC